MKHSPYFKKCLEYKTDLTRELNRRDRELAKDIESGFFAESYITGKKEENRQYRKMCDEMLKEEIARQRAFYKDALQTENDPLSSKMSDRMRNLLEISRSGIRFSLDDYKTMAARSDLSGIDKRILTETARKDGVIIDNLATDTDKALKKFDDFGKLLTQKADADTFSPESTMKLIEGEINDIINHVDTEMPVVVYEKPTDFVGVAKAIDAENEAFRKPEEPATEDEKASFRKGADMPSVGPSMDRDAIIEDVARAKAADAVEAHKKGKQDDSELSPELKDIAEGWQRMWDKNHNRPAASDAVNDTE